jgi:amino acid permease
MCCATHTPQLPQKSILERFRRFFSFINKNVVRILICFFFLFLINLAFVVRYRLVRLCEATHKVRTAVCERFQGFVLNIAIAKSPWVHETESRGIGKRLVRQHHLLHNESLALCPQMLTCSLSESVVCSLRGSRQTNKNGIRQTPPKWR